MRKLLALAIVGLITAGCGFFTPPQASSQKIPPAILQQIVAGDKAQYRKLLAQEGDPDAACTATTFTDAADAQGEIPPWKPAHGTVPTRHEWQNYLGGLRKYQRRDPNPSLIWLGDSILQRFRTVGKRTWRADYATSSQDLSLGGDLTQNLLYRETRTKELDGLDPKAVVILIGADNVEREIPSEIVKGIDAVIRQTHKRLPSAKLLVVSLTPRGTDPCYPERQWVRAVDNSLKRQILTGTLGEDNNASVLNVNSHFVASNGTEITSLFEPDTVHPSPSGYRLLSSLINAKLAAIGVTQ